MPSSQIRSVVAKSRPRANLCSDNGVMLMRSAAVLGIVLAGCLHASAWAQSVQSYADASAAKALPHADEGIGGSGSPGKAAEDHRSADGTNARRAIPASLRFSSSSQLRQYADQQRQAGALEAAVITYTHALELSSRDADSLFGRGASLHAAGSIARAIVDYDEAARLRPRWSALYEMRAHARLAQGRVDLATADLKRAIEYDPKEVDYLIALGQIRLLQGENEVAIGNLLRALQFKDDPGAMLLLHLARLRNGENGTEELRLNAGRLRSGDWRAHLFAYYEGRLPLQQILAFVRSGREGCQANFYVGLRLLHARRPDDALAMLKEAALMCDKSSLEYASAVFELKRHRR